MILSKHDPIGIGVIMRSGLCACPITNLQIIAVNAAITGRNIFVVVAIGGCSNLRAYIVYEIALMIGIKVKKRTDIIGFFPLERDDGTHIAGTSDRTIGRCSRSGKISVIGIGASKNISIG